MWTRSFRNFEKKDILPSLIEVQRLIFRRGCPGCHQCQPWWNFSSGSLCQLFCRRKKIQFWGKAVSPGFCWFLLRHYKTSPWGHIRELLFRECPSSLAPSELECLLPLIDMLTNVTRAYSVRTLYDLTAASCIAEWQLEQRSQLDWHQECPLCLQVYTKKADEPGGECSPGCFFRVTKLRLYRCIYSHEMWVL